MGPKKKGTTTIADKDTDKPVGSDTQLKSLTPTISLPNFVKEFNAFCDEEETTIVPEIVAIKNDTKIQKRSSEAIPTTAEASSKESLETAESLQEVEVIRQIFVLFDNPDKYLNLRQIHVKDFPLEIPLIRALGRLVANNPLVTVMRLENVNLTSEGLDLLAEVIVHNKTITDLHLDRNPIPEQNYHTLLENPTMINHLSLRLCNIDDEGAALLAHQLEFVVEPTQVLVSLNLSHNKITHLGAQYLANALRTNRTLVSLSLAGNRLKDEGAISLATPLGKFELTHEEIVARRRRNLARIKIREQLIDEYVKASRSSALNVGGKTSATRQASPMKTKKVNVDNNLQRTGSSKKKFGSRESRSTTKVMSKTNTKVAPGTPSTASTAAAYSASTDALSIKEKEKAALAAEHRRIELIVEQQMEEDHHPYSHDVWPENLSLFCQGNHRLAHLNLAHNGIGSTGLTALHKALRDQDETLLWHEETVRRQGPRGVLRLTLQGNPIPPANSESLADLQDHLTLRLETLNASQLSLGRPPSVTTSLKPPGGKSGSPQRSKTRQDPREL